MKSITRVLSTSILALGLAQSAFAGKFSDGFKTGAGETAGVAAVFAAISSITLSLSTTSGSHNHPHAALKNAQPDAIQYVQQLENGDAGVMTPALQKGVEVVATLPEAAGLSQDHLVYALALANLN